MRAVTVYRVDYVWNTRKPIGVVMERRRRERKNNFFDLLRLARHLYARDATDAMCIVIDGKEARRAYCPELRTTWPGETAEG